MAYQSKDPDPSEARKEVAAKIFAEGIFGELNTHREYLSGLRVSCRLMVLFWFSLLLYLYAGSSLAVDRVLGRVESVLVIAGFAILLLSLFSWVTLEVVVRRLQRKSDVSASALLDFDARSSKSIDYYIHAKYIYDAERDSLFFFRYWLLYEPLMMFLVSSYVFFFTLRFIGL